MSVTGHLRRLPLGRCEGRRPVLRLKNVRKLTTVVVASLSTIAPALGQTTPTVTYQYDALGRLVKAEYASGAVRDFHYDPAGNRRSVFTLVAGGGSTPSGGTTAADGKLLTVHTPGGPIIVTVPN